MEKSRARRREGRRCYRVECDEAALEIALAELGYLPQGRDCSPRDIEAALSRMLERLLAQVAS